MVTPTNFISCTKSCPLRFLFLLPFQFKPYTFCIAIRYTDFFYYSAWTLKCCFFFTYLHKCCVRYSEYMLQCVNSQHRE